MSLNITKAVLIIVTFLTITFDLYLYFSEQVTISEQLQFWGLTMPLEYVYGFLGSHFFFSVKSRYFSMNFGLLLGSMVLFGLSFLNLGPFAEMVIGLVCGYLFWPQES